MEYERGPPASTFNARHLLNSRHRLNFDTLESVDLLKTKLLHVVKSHRVRTPFGRALARKRKSRTVTWPRTIVTQPTMGATTLTRGIFGRGPVEAVIQAETAAESGCKKH